MKLIKLLERMDGDEVILIYDEDVQRVVFHGKMLDIPTEICIGGYQVTRVSAKADFLELDIKG